MVAVARSSKKQIDMDNVQEPFCLYGSNGSKVQICCSSVNKTNEVIYRNTYILKITNIPYNQTDSLSYSIHIRLSCAQLYTSIPLYP